MTHRDRPTLAELQREEAEAHGYVDETLHEDDFPLTVEEEEMAPLDHVALAAQCSRDLARLRSMYARVA